MKNRFLNYISLVTVVTLLFTSCIKKGEEDLGDEGPTLIKFLEAPENKLFFEPFNEIRTMSLFSLRKDAANPSELSGPITVKLKMDPGLIADYNAAHNETFEVLPDSLYTLSPNFTRAGNIYTATFNSGDFAKEFIINLNGSKWNLSKKYALAFTIDDPGGETLSAEKKEIIVLIAIKNKWDGVYVATGTMVDLTNATLTGIHDDPGNYGVDLEYALETVSATSVQVRDINYTGGIFTPIWAGTGWSYYGAFGLVVTFDPATDKVVSVVNYHGQPAANTRSAQLDPSGINQYNASTKTIDIKYWMKQPSVVATPPNIRSVYTENWKYIRSR